MKCPYCNTENSKEAKFCVNCGKPLKTEIEEELKIASILVLDIKGYSKILEKLEVDDTAELIKKLFENFQREIERYGGKVIKFLGDGMICAFGIPISIDNYIDRAIFSALSILEKLKHFQKEFPEISVKIAISSGKVWKGIIGEKLDLLGEPINVAVYLQEFCPPNGIIVPSETLKLTTQKFLYRKLGIFKPQKLDKPIKTYLILGKGREKKTPKITFVGRQKEMNLIEEKLKDLKAKGFLIIIEGEEGIGKSRLVKEMREKFKEDFVWYKGRAYSYISNFPYYPILEIIKEIWNVKKEKGIETKINKNIELIFSKKESFLPLEYYKALLKSLFLISKEDFLEKWDQKSKEQIWKILLEEILVFAYKQKRKPLVIILEDLHWADSSTLKILKDITLLKDLFPIGFIFTIRKSYKNFIKNLPIDLTISLSPLSFEESIQFLKQNLSNLSLDTIGKISERFGGNPLFLEEVSRIIKEKKLMDSEEILGIIPENIQGIIQKRVDSLDYLSKKVLQWASIVGRKFSLKDILAISEKVPESKIKNTLSNLINLGFIRKSGRTNYTFHHFITHKVVYETIPRAIRRKYHIIYAENLEKTGNIKDTAYHYFHGEDPRSLKYLFILAQISFANSSYDETLNIGKEIESLIKNKFKAELKILKDLYLLMGNCYLILGAIEKSIEAFKEALNYVTYNEDYSEVFRRIAWCLNRKGELEKSLENLEKGEGKIQDKNSKVYGNILADKAWILFRMGKIDEAIDCLKKSLNILEKLKDEEILAKAYNNFGVILWSIGDLNLSLEYQKKNLELSKKTKDPIKIFSSYNNIGVIYESMGDFKKAKDFYEEALTLCERIKYSLGIAHSLCNLGNCHFKMDNLDIAEKYIEKAINLWESLNIEEWLPLSYIYLCNIKIRKKEIKEAEEILRKIEKRYFNHIKNLPEEKLFLKTLLHIEFLKRLDKKEEKFNDIINSLIELWNYFTERKDLENTVDTSILLAEIFKEEKNIEKFNFFIENALSIYKRLNHKKGIEKVNELRREIERIL